MNNKKYKVDNAIIMAAGKSSRFVPLSIETHKGLTNVKGEIIIERQIRQLIEAGINDIVIVTGYKHEQFDYLKDKYNVKLVYNPEYSIKNNISSLLCVKDYLKNSYICCSDNYFTTNLFELYHDDSFYSALYTDSKTDEYCLTIDDKGLITDVVIGGSNAWYMFGHVFFSEDFSNKLVLLMEEAVKNPYYDDKLWERLYMDNLDTLNMYVKKYTDEIFEFDSIDDLRLFDTSYINNIDSQIIRNICSVFKCQPRDLVNFVPMNKGFMNASMVFTYNNKKYVYRHPSESSKSIINRYSEKFALNEASKLKIDDTTIHFDDSGWKISHYIDNLGDLDYQNPQHVAEAIVLFKRLHQARIVSEYDFDIWGKTLNYIKLIKENDYKIDSSFQEMFATIESIYKSLDKSNSILCHMDAYDANFMVSESRLYLIDWEFASNSDPACDLGTFICCSEYTLQEGLAVVKQYLGKDYDKLLKHYVGYIAITSFQWLTWAMYKESIKEDVGDFVNVYKRHTKEYSQYYKELV